METVTESIGELRQWLASAGPGESFAYARAPRCPRGDIAHEVRLLHDTGLLALKQRKIGPGLYEYLAEKRRDVQPPRFGFHDLARGGAPENAVQKVVVQMRRAESFGEPMPDRRTLARATRMAPEAVDRALGLLASAGQIEIRRLRPIKKIIKTRVRMRGVKAS